jgi:hypothetical protein
MIKNQELPGVTGKGVEPLSINEIDQAIVKYEKRKEARCAESPGEVEAKKKLRDALHEHRDQLLIGENGERYYRLDDVDYVLEEVLKRRKVSADETGKQFD